MSRFILTMARRAISSARHKGAVTSWGGLHVDRSIPSCQHLGKHTYSTVHGGSIGVDGLPISVDWREKGVIFNVWRQGKCGGCWAFTAADTIQTLNVIKGNTPLKLSPQQLLDCVDFPCRGCHGGFPDLALSYVLRNGGLISYDEYPCSGWYTRKHRHVSGIGTRISGFECHENVTEQELKGLVASQPVIASVGADKEFGFYSDGIVDGPNYTLKQMFEMKRAHLVVVIGYGLDNYGVEYWVIRNSWGCEYGLGGYWLLARNNGKPGGAFGLCRLIAYPLMNFSNGTGARHAETHVVVKSEFALKEMDLSPYSIF